MTSTAQARMEEVIAANPRIGRVRLEKLAGVVAGGGGKVMACFICPENGAQMCGVRSCAECGECQRADWVDGKPSSRDYDQGVTIGQGRKTAQNGNMEAGS